MSDYLDDFEELSIAQKEIKQLRVELATYHTPQEWNELNDLLIVETAKNEELLAALEKVSGALDREIHSKPCDLYYTEMFASFERELKAMKSANTEMADQRYAQSKEILRLKRSEDDLVKEISELSAALHNLVEACFRADNEGELASEIDGSLMDAAWKALK